MQANLENSSEVILRDSLCTYISICNDVIDANKTRFPFIQMWRALETEIAGRTIEYSVVRDESLAKITATFIDLKINIIPSTPVKKWPQVTQKIEWPYMSFVLEKPAKFIANPTLMNWNLKIDDKVVQLFS